jgi:putative tryptophan/tyrosine transport system substrate-binding protein
MRDVGYVDRTILARLPAKQMELAREIVPAAKRVGLLNNLKDPKAPRRVNELQTAGQAVETTIIAADVSRPDEIDDALQRLADE